MERDKLCFLKNQVAIQNQLNEKRKEHKMQIDEIAVRLENDTVKARKAAEARKPMATKEKADRIARCNRINKDRSVMQPTMMNAFSQINEFRKDIKGFKEMTIEASKKYIMDLEAAGKRDRVKWMQQQSTGDSFWALIISTL